MVGGKEKEFFILMQNHGRVIDMKVNIEMVIKKEKEFIILQMVVDMMVNGEMIKKKEKEFLFMQKVVIDMKVNGEMI